SSFSSESCPKREAEEVEAEQEENEINEVSSVSAKIKSSQSIRDESSEGERCSTQGTPHSRASDRNSKRSDSEITPEVSCCINAKEISEDEKAEKKDVEEAENEANVEVGIETAEGTTVNEEAEECVSQEQISEVVSEAAKADQAECSQDCPLMAQKTAECKSVGQVDNVETGTEQTEAEKQSKEEEQSSRPSTACSKSKGEDEAQSIREDSLIQEAEENKEDQCSTCENGQEEGGENENEDNRRLAENGEEEEAEAVNEELPKENLKEEADQLATTDDTNINDADCGTELKTDLEEQLEKEPPNDPKPNVNMATRGEKCDENDEEPTSNDPDKAHEKHEDKGNKNSEKSSKVRCKKASKRLDTLNKAAAFSCYSSVGNFSQQSQKGSEDEGEEECKYDNNPMNNHPNGEVQSDESSRPSQMYPDSEEEEDKASSCIDPLGDEDQADAESADPKEVEHTDEVQASKKKEDSDEINQDDLD
ncbi:hypothetical protein N306_06844, partial [Opisthocomus hoazin]